MRILIDVTEKQVQSLAALAAREGKPRAAIIRNAIDAHLATTGKSPAAYFGLTAGKYAEDASAVQARLRAEWEE